MKLYDLNSIDRLIAALSERGYDYYQIEEGTLGYGEVLMLSPDEEKYYHYVITERYLNCWSSAHSVRRVGKLSKRFLAAIDF